MPSQELLPIRIDESRMGGIIRILSWHNEGEPDQKGTTYHGLAGPSISPHHIYWSEKTQVSVLQPLKWAPFS